MTELINKQKVIRLFIEGDGHDDDRFTEGYNFAVEEYRNAIKNIKPVDNWIPCIEKLPEQLVNVLVCTDIKTVALAWLNGDHWTFADTGNGHTENWSFDAVTHWQPMPKPVGNKHMEAEGGKQE